MNPPRVATKPQRVIRKHKHRKSPRKCCPVVVKPALKGVSTPTPGHAKT